MNDEFDIVDELETNPEVRRPLFLTVLCILTWVGSGTMFLYYIYIFWGAAFFADKFAGGTNISSWLNLTLVVGLIAQLFTIAGAVFIWNLRKWGFVIYTIGELVPSLMSIYMYAFMLNTTGAGLVFAFIPAVIPIGFVVMYALHLKYMRW